MMVSIVMGPSQTRTVQSPCRPLAWRLLRSGDGGGEDGRVIERPWWQRGAIYQLLVPSFLDTDGDGLGDLDGITARLDYLEWLGVSAIWLSPCYPSPLKELGY